MLVACATDRRFVELSAVMLRSFVANADLPNAKIVVFEDGLRESDRIQIRAAAAPSPVRFVDLAGASALIGRLPVKRHWPTANYGRLVVPDLIADSGRLLYLDCDIIINRSLRELAELDLKGLPAAAVPDQTPEWRRQTNLRLGRPEEWPRFNAGVVLIDLDEWRRRGMTTRILEWIANNREKIVGLSQDPLTVALADDWVKLDQSYNFQGRGIKDASAFTAAHIIHFTGAIKPDHEGCGHGATSIYVQHRSFTPWKDRPLISPRQRKLRRLGDNIKMALRRFWTLNWT